MTAQAPHTNVVHSIRFNLPVQAMKAIVFRMIEQKQRRAFLDIPAHLRAQARAAAVAGEEVAQPV